LPVVEEASHASRASIFGVGIVVVGRCRVATGAQGNQLSLITPPMPPALWGNENACVGVAIQ